MGITTTTPVGEPIAAVGLRVGSWVRVRSREDILATLDDQGRVDGLPFMPEMLDFAGRSFPVSAVTHRTCDTVKTSGTSGTTRRMERAVHLGELRCDGTAHGGCQARCLLYWKEDWLEPISGSQQSDMGEDTAPERANHVPAVLKAGAHGAGHTDDDPVYTCQATEMLRATQFVSVRDPRMWVKDVRSGNARLTTALASLAVLLFNKWQSFSTRLPKRLRIKNGRLWPWIQPTGERVTHPPLNLLPGELVEVKSLSEIEATLNENGAIRGLRFAAEMIPYCGKQARVKARVERIIDEKTGRILKLRDCIILEDVWCQGTFRALCRRKIYSYWREAWLRRVDPSSSAE